MVRCARTEYNTVLLLVKDRCAPNDARSPTTRSIGDSSGGGKLERVSLSAAKRTVRSRRLVPSTAHSTTISNKAV